MPLKNTPGTFGTKVCIIDINYILNPDLPSNYFPRFSDDISTWPSISSVN